jgi:hypothetical protein
MVFRRGEWLLLAATAIAYLAFVPVRWLIERQAGCAFIAPDMNFPPDFAAYSAAKACLTGNGGAGLNAFARWHSLGLDLVFPALLAFAATVIVLRVGDGLPRFSALGINVKWLAAAVLPVTYAVADYVENWNVIRWLKSGDDGLLPLISALTTLKFAALIVAAIVAAALFLATLKHKRLS